MKTSTTCLSVLMAGMLAAAGVQAQSAPAGGNSDGPPKAGEASNQTMGQPNAMTSNSPVTEAPIAGKDAVRQDAQGRSGAAATVSVPGKAGEASTSVQGKPNADPNDPAQRVSQYMGAGAAREIGVPATLPAGSLSVFRGGTPQ